MQAHPFHFSNDFKVSHRLELESMFGVDFGEPGDRGLELV
jgi:hypothetical protein